MGVNSAGAAALNLTRSILLATRDEQDDPDDGHMIKPEAISDMTEEVTFLFNT